MPLPILGYCPSCQFPPWDQPPHTAKVLCAVQTDFGPLELCALCSLEHRAHPSAWLMRLVDWLFPTRMLPWL